MSDIKEYLIFLSSPDDVKEERAIAKEFIESHNKNLREYGVRFEPVDGNDSNILPISEGNPIETVKKNLERQGKSFLLYIGIMGERFGSSTGKDSSGKEYPSGTYAEFLYARDLKGRNKLPEIKFFFKDIRNGVVRTAGESLRQYQARMEQYLEVCKFREEMEKEKKFQLGYFSSPKDFQSLLEKDVAPWLLKKLLPPSDGKSAGKVPEIQDTQHNPLVENAPVLLCFTNPKGQENKGIWELTEINDAAWAEVLGYPNKDAVSKQIQVLDTHARRIGTDTDIGLRHLIHPEDRKDTIQQMKRFEEEPDFRQRGFLNRYLHSDGSYRWIEWSSNIIREKENTKRTLIYSAGADVTKYRIQSELYKSMNDVESTGYALAERLAKILEELIKYDVFFLNSHYVWNPHSIREESSRDDNIIILSREYRGPKEWRERLEESPVESDKAFSNLFAGGRIKSRSVTSKLDDLVDSEKLKSNLFLKGLSEDSSSLLYLPIPSNQFIFSLCLVRAKSEYENRFDDHYLQLIDSLELETYLIALQRKRLSEPMRKALQLL